jgi:hypothetical protein
MDEFVVFEDFFEALELGISSSHHPPADDTGFLTACRFGVVPAHEHGCFGVFPCRKQFIRDLHPFLS